MSPSRGVVLLALVLVIAGAVWGALHRDPWDPDETRYLQVADEMATGGSPFFLTFGGEPYTDKPPLFFWLLAPAVAALGARSALAGVVPSIVATLLLAMATARLGRRAGLDPDATRWGTLLTLTALLPALLAGGCRMDLLFAALCALALERLVALASPEATKADHLMLWLWLALAVLTKGPLALALPLIAALILLPATGGLLRRAVVGWGPLLALGVLAIWMVPAALTGGSSWLETIVVHQSAGRVVGSFAHQEPWWYHLAVLPLTLLPWSPAVLFGALAAFAQRQALPERARLLPAYAAGTLVFLSLLSGKTFLYPLPLFAPACLIAAWWLLRRPRSLGPRAALVLGGAAMTTVGVGLALVAMRRHDMHLTLATAVLLAASLALPAVVAMAAALTARTRAAMTALALAVPLFAAVGIQTIVPSFNALLSLRPFGRAYQAAAPPGPGFAFGRLQPGYMLFTGRRFEVLTTPDALDGALAAGRVVAIGERDAARVAAETGMGWRELVRIPYRHSTILLVDRPHSTGTL